MAGDRFVLRSDVDGCDDCVSGRIELFNFTVPFAGILAVRPDELLHSEMFIGVMPVYLGISMELFTDFVRVLPKNSVPKGGDFVFPDFHIKRSPKLK